MRKSVGLFCNNELENFDNVMEKSHRGRQD